MDDYNDDFGHFSLSLNASQSQALPKLSHTIVKVESLLKDYPDGFTANAIRNLLGALHYYNSSPDKALTRFQEVLKDDASNENALSNQIFVYKRLFRTKKADDILQRLGEIRKKSESTISTSNIIKKAECGFAYLFDCYINNIRPRWEKCTIMFENVLETIDKIKDIDLALYIELKFWTMQSYQKRYDTDVRDRKHKETFNKAVGIIHEIIEKVKSDEMKDKRKPITLSNITGVSWAYLGTFLFKNPTAKWNEQGVIEVDDTEIPDVVRDVGFAEHFKNPGICFENALKENKDNREVRIRFANYLRNIKIDEHAATEENKRRLYEAMEHVHHSLKIDDTEANWFGRTVRAEIFFTLFRIFKDKKHLEKSIDDWEKAINFTQTAWNFKQLAEAYRLMAVKEGADEEIDFEKDEYITKASIYFWKAVQSLGTEKKPEIHRSHGRFLRNLGDKRESVECFKRAMEIDTAHKPTKSFEHLFETFLQMYDEQHDQLKNELTEASSSDERKIELKVDRLLFEIAFWFRMAVKKYNALKETQPGSNVSEETSIQRTITRSKSVFIPEAGRVTDVDAFKSDQAADLFKEHTKRFNEKYKRGMAHLCAYFKTVSEGSSEKIAKMIENSVESLAEDTDWKAFKEGWTQRRIELGEHSRLTSCPTCGHLTEKITFSDPPEKARNECFKYDFYVIYPENQREWVLYSLLQKVEGIYGFKGSILERDAMPGSNTLNSIKNLISQSHRILAIMTREFQTDMWCMRSLDTAETLSLNENRENFIIPILLESSEMPDRLSTVICLDVVDYFDWDKLVRAISQR